MMMPFDNLPRVDELLFRGDLPDWQNNAHLSEADAAAYSEGYRRAARQLTLLVIESGHGQDVLIYPVVFLYRHYVELAVKSVLSRMEYLLDSPFPSVIKDHLVGHRINALWTDLKPLLSQLCETVGWSKIADDLLRVVDSHIIQLCQIDPHSFAFRYATQKNSKISSLPPNLKLINIRHFSDIMEKLCDFFEALEHLPFS